MTKASSPTPPRRGRARRGEGQQLREQILDAAHALLLETGDADKVSTRAVAQRVGCTSPSLYLHFPDRAALLYAVCQRQFERMRDHLQEAVGDVDGPMEKLTKLAHTYVAFGLEHTEEYRIMMMMPDTGYVWDVDYDDLRREAGFDILHDVLVEAMAAGELAEDDPTLMAITVWFFVHGMVSLRIAKPSFDWPPVEELVDRMCAELFDGLRARSQPADESAGKPTKETAKKTARKAKAASKAKKARPTGKQPAKKARPAGKQPAGKQPDEARRSPAARPASPRR